MTRFRVYASVDDGALLLEVQANLLEHLNTRAVVPLIPIAAAPKAAKILNPRFEIGETTYVLATQFLATVPRRLLGAEVADLQAEASVIVNALDCLFQGV
ncbi:MAG: CcdB family protein [Burkholderiaceae bacterium]|nr:CcdB family protein [Roseateles sp.]MBV8470462.1 CcdB family protein [Burkholderiaceae bacterium]